MSDHRIDRQLEISEATQRDVAVVASFLQTSYAACYPNAYGVTRDLFTNDSFGSHLHAYVSDKISEAATTIWAARVGDLVLGTIGLGTNESGDGEIFSFYVAEQKQRRGIGKLLWQTMINSEPRAGCSRLNLLVGDSLLPAISFYESHGFERIGALTKQVPTTTDASLTLDYLIMEKVL